MLRLAWFTTGRGPGSRRLFSLVRSEIEADELNASVEFVFCNREFGETDATDGFLRLVQDSDVPLVTFSSRRFRREHGGGPFSDHRIEFHKAVLDRISSYQPDICVFSGYMLFTGPEIVDQFQTINLHPALPGTAEGTYQQVIWKLIEERSTESGVTIHVATEILDDGAPLSYCTYPIRGPEFDDLWTEIEDVPIRQLISEGEEQPLFRAIRRHGAIREAPLLIETLKSLADGRIRIHNGRVVDEQLVETDGLSLDKEVECALNDCSR